jgi:hypothetical protein
MNIDVVVLIERGLRFHVIADYDNSPVQIRNSSTTTPWEAPILKVSDEENVKDTMGPLIPLPQPPRPSAGSRLHPLLFLFLSREQMEERGFPYLDLQHRFSDSQ